MSVHFGLAPAIAKHAGFAVLSNPDLMNEFRQILLHGYCIVEDWPGYIRALNDAGLIDYSGDYVDFEERDVYAWVVSEDALRVIDEVAACVS